MTKEVVHRNALPKGSQLNEYVIEKVLGEPGGFGVAYLARDGNLDQLVAIKEYLPNDLAMREGTTVYPKSTHDDEDFTWGLDRFLDEARTLAKFKHPNIVQVLRYFKANNTGYMVMSYEDGLPLNEILKENHLTEEELVQNILLPLIDGLKQVHAAGFLHRDIKPGNIYMRRSDETPVLLDFGAARNALGSKSKSLTSIVTPGYAPFEQYHSDGNQGAWSDIYALGAVAYRIVTGKKPPEAPSRIRKDKMIPAVDAAKGKYSERLLKAIDRALAVDEEDRPQSCEKWKRELTEQAVAEPVTRPEKLADQPTNFQNEKTKPSEKSTEPNSEKHKELSETETSPKKKGNILKFFVGIAVLIAGVIIAQQMTQQSNEIQQTKVMLEQLKQEKARQEAEEIARNKVIKQERQKAEEQARQEAKAKASQEQARKEAEAKASQEKARKEAATRVMKKNSQKKQKQVIAQAKKKLKAFRNQAYFSSSIFISESGKLSSSSEKLKLVRIAKNYARMKKQGKSVEISLIGNTDDRGGRSDNLAKGERFARSVMQILIKNGVTKEDVKTVSYGEERPVCVGQAAVCRALNRRVDVYAQDIAAKVTFNSVAERQAASCSETTTSFKVNRDSTVTDKITGLMWKQCSEGLSGSACKDGKAKEYTWDASMEHAKSLNNHGGFAGYKDWRVPTIEELGSIEQRKCKVPNINHKIFPATHRDTYWSASPYAAFTTLARGVNFGFDGANEDLKALSNYVRLVRGGQ